MSKAEKIIEEINQKIDQARGIVAVMWEENKIAIRDIDVPEKLGELKEDNSSPLIKRLENVNHQLDQLIIEANSLRDSLDL